MTRLLKKEQEPLQVQLKIYFSLSALKWVHIYTRCDRKKIIWILTKVVSVFFLYNSPEYQQGNRRKEKTHNFGWYIIQHLWFYWWVFFLNIWLEHPHPHPKTHSQHTFGKSPWTYLPFPPKHSVHFKKQAQWHFLFIMTSVIFWNTVHPHCNSLCCKANLDIRQTP